MENIAGPVVPHANAESLDYACRRWRIDMLRSG